MPAKMAAILFLIKQGGAIGEKRERIALEMEGVLHSVPKARSARVRQIWKKKNILIKSNMAAKMAAILKMYVPM